MQRSGAAAGTGANEPPSLPMTGMREGGCKRPPNKQGRDLGPLLLVRIG